MTVNQIKDVFNKIIDYRLYINNVLPPSLQSEYDEVISNTINSPSISSLISELVSLKNNDNALIYNGLLSGFIKDLELKPADITTLLNNTEAATIDDYHKALWDLLLPNDKITYLESKQSFNEFDTSLINYACQKNYNPQKNMILNYLITENGVYSKLANNSLDLLINDTNLSSFDLENELFCQKLSNSSYQILIIKKFPLINEFLTYYLNHQSLMTKINKYSLSFKDLDQESLDLVWQKAPALWQLVKEDQIKGFGQKNIKAKINNELDLSISDLAKAPDFSLDFYPTNIAKIKQKPSLLIKFSPSFITLIINNEFNEEDKISILRNEALIKGMDSLAIEQIIARMSFKAAFNLLQSQIILNKIQNFSAQVSNQDSLLIKGFIDSPALINKATHEMITKMLLTIESQDCAYYLTRPYICNKLMNGELITVLSTKLIDLANLDNNDIVLSRLSRSDLELYVDAFWLQDVNLKIINNELVYQKLFNLTDDQMTKIEIEEINYLFETIKTKSNLTIQCTKVSLASYRSVLHSYLALGLKKSLELMNNGNKIISFDKLKKTKQDFIQSSLLDFKIEHSNILESLHQKIINNLDLLAKNNLVNLESDLMANHFFADLIKQVRESGYADFEEIITVLALYLNQKKEDNLQAKKQIFAFSNGFVEHLLAKEEEKQRKEFEKLLDHHFEIKEAVAFRKRTVFGKQYLQTLKWQLLAKLLTNPQDSKRFSFALKRNVEGEELKDLLQKKLKLTDSSFQQVIDFIIKPTAQNKFALDDCLKALEIDKPEGYDNYRQYQDEAQLIGKFNSYLTSKKNNFSSEQKMAIINYACYKTPLSLPQTIKEKNIIKGYQTELVKFRKRIIIDKTKMQLEYAKKYLLENEDSVYDYENYYIELTNIIKIIQKFISYYFDEIKIKDHYSQKYTQVISQVNLDLPLNAKYYEPKKRLFGLHDFEKIFDTSDLSDVKKLSKTVIKKLFSNYDLIIIAEGYWPKINCFGKLLAKITQIESICKDLKINFNHLNLADLVNLTNQINGIDNVIYNMINKDNLAALQENMNASSIIRLGIDVLQQGDSTIPYLKGNVEDITYTRVYSLNELNSEAFISSELDLTKYCLLNKNGALINVLSEQQVIGTIKLVRNGNTVYIHPFKLQKEVNINNLLNHLADNLIATSSNSNEPIELVICYSDELALASNIALESSLTGILDQPINTCFDDYRIFINHYTKEHSLKTKYGYYPAYLLSANIPFDKYAIKTYDPKANYLRPRGKIMTISPLASKEEINQVNYLLYNYLEGIDDSNNIIREYEEIDINKYAVIYYGDDWLITINKDNEINKYVLPYDLKAITETDSLIQNLTKGDDVSELHWQSQRLQKR